MWRMPLPALVRQRPVASGVCAWRVARARWSAPVTDGRVVSRLEATCSVRERVGLTAASAPGGSRSREATDATHLP
jgi:hypothetical protein